MKAIKEVNQFLPNQVQRKKLLPRLPGKTGEELND